MKNKIVVLAAISQLALTPALAAVDPADSTPAAPVTDQQSLPQEQPGPATAAPVSATPATVAPATPATAAPATPASTSRRRRTSETETAPAVHAPTPPATSPAASKQPVTPAGTTAPGTTVAQPAPPEGTLAPVKSKLKDDHPHFSLTLAGGGARGAAHVGVLKALDRAGLKPDFIAGSSIGAVVGSLYAAGVPTCRIEEAFLHGDIEKAFLPTKLGIQVLKFGPTYAFDRVFRKKTPVGIYSGKSLEKFMRRHLPANRQRIEDFKIPFAAIATNVLDTRPVWVTDGDAAQVARASATVPIIYKSVPYKGKELLDGGIRANLPTSPAQAARSNVVVAVRLYSSLEAAPPGSFRSIKGLWDRTLSMLMAEVESKGTNGADVLIDPQLGNLPVYSFDAMSAAKAIAAGERAAEKMIPEIRKKLQANVGVADNSIGPKEPVAAPPEGGIPQQPGTAPAMNSAIPGAGYR